MKRKHALVGFFVLTLFLLLTPTALAASTWYVDGVHGSDSNNCKSPQTACKTIGHAITLASPGDTIMVAAATYMENLTISMSLTIHGDFATTAPTIIDGGGVNTVVTIPNAGTNVSLSKLTIRNGSMNDYGGGIYNTGTLTITNSTVSGNSATNGRCVEGGGIYNSGTLTITNSTVIGNSATSECGKGGGIENFYGGTLTIAGSTISENITTGAGGGIYNFGTTTINNATISGNSAPYGGGGIENYSTVTINSSTLSGNSAPSGGGGVYNDGGTATIQNSIVSNSLSGGNCHSSGGAINSSGYNLSSDGTCPFNNTGDLNNTDPKLGLLQNNGGPTWTQALLDGSPAIDAGNPSGCTDGNGNLLKTDQRSAPRPDPEDPGGCDMGAYERQRD